MLFCLVGQGIFFLIMHWHIFGETSMLDIGRGYIIARVEMGVRGLSLKEGKNMCWIYTPSLTWQH